MDTAHEQTERTFRFDCRKLLLLFVPLAILVGLSLLLNAEAWLDAPVWVYFVFGGIGLLLVFCCLVAPRRHFLRLTPQGLTIQYLASHRHYSWDEVLNFRVTSGPNVDAMSTGNRVVFDLAENSPQRTAVVRGLAAINGYDVSIMAWFGINGADLVMVLNEWQQQYGKMS